MKWPLRLMLIRHDVSAYNLLKTKRSSDKLYQRFLKSWEANSNSPETITLAQEVYAKTALGLGDAATPLADKEGRQAYTTGLELAKNTSVPDVIFVSPYERALKTLEHLTRGWPDLENVATYEDDRVREQEHGLALLYNDWRVFHSLHPEQKKLYELEGRYWYRYPQGENVPDVRDRNRSWLNTLTRDFANKRVLVVTHHLNILATRANLERLDAKEFIRLDEHEKPINCGVTMYEGKPDEGSDGRLKLSVYNHKYYK